jgi:hypothetical protein
MKWDNGELLWYRLRTSSNRQAILRTIEHELAKFEKRERKFVARERRERADQLGLPIFGLRKPKRLSQSGDTVA